MTREELKSTGLQHWNCAIVRSADGRAYYAEIYADDGHTVWISENYTNEKSALRAAKNG